MTKTQFALRAALIGGASLLAMSGAAHAQAAQTPEQQQARIEPRREEATPPLRGGLGLERFCNSSKAGRSLEEWLR